MRKKVLVWVGASVALVALVAFAAVRGAVEFEEQAAPVAVETDAAAPEAARSPEVIGEPDAPVVAPERSVERTDATPAGAAGMVVAIDPESGQLGMPSPEQMAELNAGADLSLNRSSVGLVEERHPSGAVTVDLQGRFQEYSAARVGPDGHVRFDCAHDAEAVETLSKGEAPVWEDR